VSTIKEEIDIVIMTREEWILFCETALIQIIESEAEVFIRLKNEEGPVEIT